MKILVNYVAVLLLLVSFSVEASAQFAKNFTYGASGEIHYNDVVRDENGPAAAGEVDFHKATFKAGYKIDKHWSVASKLKIEHAFDSKYNGGDVYVDNLYLKYKASKAFNVQAGIISVPISGGKSKVYGTVELSPVEKYMSFAWREAGIGFSGEFKNSLSYRATFTTGLNPAELQSKSVIYGARNARFYDSTQNFATGLQLKYEPLFNVTVGTSFLYSTLGNSKVYGVDLSGANYRIAEAFAIYTNGHFETRVVGVYSSVAESEKINEVFKNKIGSAQFGTLLEVSHDFTRFFNFKSPDAHLKGFLRTEVYDSHYRTSGIADNSKYEHTDYSLGIVYQPISVIEFKADYQILRAGGYASHHMFDFSIGYNF